MPPAVKAVALPRFSVCKHQYSRSGSGGTIVKTLLLATAICRLWRHKSSRMRRRRPTGADHLWMEAFERRNFVIWPGARGDAARAPLASRDAVQGAKDQVQTIIRHQSWSNTRLRQAWTSFPRQRRQNPRTMRCIALAVFPSWHEKSCPPNRFQLKMIGSSFLFRPIHPIAVSARTLCPESPAAVPDHPTA
jgi:hypothetical protein